MTPLPPVRFGAFLLAASAALAQVTSYHGVTSATHQSQFNTLTGQGYTLISLAVSGGLASPRYSAAWERRGAGPNWVAFHDLSAAQYVTRRNSLVASGYRPRLLSVAGAGTDTVHAGVFVADNVTVQYDDNYSATGFANQCAWAHDHGYLPVSVDVHGDATSPLFAAVFEPNTRDVGWGHVVDATHTAFVETYGAHTDADHRLACLGMSESQGYVSVWLDDRIGQVAVRSNYTTSGFQTQVTALANSGYDLLAVAAGGTGTGLRHAGAFATQRTATTPTLTVTGTADPTFAAFDTYLRNHIQAENARAASIAISKNGRLVYARAYTFAEPGYGYPITQPTDSFRIASLAKVPTAIAVHELLETYPRYTMASRPFAILGVDLGSLGGDLRLPNITLQHCLEYRTGFPRNYGAADIADWWYDRLGVPTILPAVRAMGEPWLGARPQLLFTPGGLCSYGNPAHFLAGQVVEHVSGQDLQTFLHSRVYGPLGITRPRVAASLRSQVPTDETLSHSRDLTLAASELHSNRRRLAPQYAFDLGFKNGSGGTAFSTVDYVRLMAGVLDLGADRIVTSQATRDFMIERHTYTPTPDNDGLSQVCPLSMSWDARANGVFAYKKGGTLGSASATAIWRTDGVCIAVFLNRDSAHADDATLNTAADAIPDWPSHDLFPNYGLPSFPRRPTLTGVDPGTLGNVGNTPFVLTGEQFQATTAVSFGTTTITSTSPTSWLTGWFRVVDAGTIELYPPQNRVPGAFPVRVHNALGSSSAVTVSLTPNSGFLLATAPQVGPGQASAAICSRSVMSAGSLAVFGISTSNLPSAIPGTVSLGIGAQFADLIVSDLVGFDANTRTATLPLPPLPWPSVYVQAAALDPLAPAPLPLHTSNVRQIVRL